MTTESETGMEQAAETKLGYIGLSAVVTRADGTVEDLGILCEDFSDEERARIDAQLRAESDEG